MSNLATRAADLMENVKPVCRKDDDGIAWEKFIVTVKSKEVVAWSFDCLTCDHRTCPRIKANRVHSQETCWSPSDF